MSKKNIVLLSGGLDSCVMAALAKQEGEVIALSFDYGQRHRHELSAASAIAHALDLEHHIIPLFISGSSSLVDKTKSLQKNRTHKEIAEGGIPSTYVHARNTLFLSHATSFAEAVGASSLFFGANLYDYECYPDCRPAFFNAFNELLKVATARTIPITIQTPLINMSKKEIILQGLRLGAPLELSFSCYDPINEEACLTCDACVLRSQGFKEAAEALLTESYPFSHTYENLTDYNHTPFYSRSTLP